MAHNALVIDRLPRRQLLKLAVGGLALGAAGGLSRRGALAQGATPVPIVEATPEQLFEVTLPRSTFPLDGYYSGFLQTTFDPGFEGTLVITDQIAMNIIVLDGAMTIEKSGAARVFRRGGAEEVIGQDNTLVLEAGDVRLIQDFSRPQLISNRGTVPLHALYAPIGFPTEYWKDVTGTSNDTPWTMMSDTDWRAGGLSGKALHLRFDRFTIKPGETTIKGRDSYPVMRLLYPGSLSQTITQSDGSVSGPFQLTEVGLLWLMDERLKEVAWTNVGDEPAVIYEYALQPVEEGPATPVA